MSKNLVLLMMSGGKIAGSAIKHVKLRKLLFKGELIMTKALDLLGKKFGNITAIERLPNSESGQTQWLWKCDCGETFKSNGGARNSKYKSCATCWNKIRGYESRKYNDLEDYKPVYQTWRGMKERCNNPNNSHYPCYGALGIKVCDSWSDKEDGFRNFYNDMGKRPSNMTLDRIDGLTQQHKLTIQKESTSTSREGLGLGTKKDVVKISG